MSRILSWLTVIGMVGWSISCQPKPTLEQKNKTKVYYESDITMSEVSATQAAIDQYDWEGSYRLQNVGAIKHLRLHLSYDNSYQLFATLNHPDATSILIDEGKMIWNQGADGFMLKSNNATHDLVEIQPMLQNKYLIASNGVIVVNALDNSKSRFDKID